MLQKIKRYKQVLHFFTRDERIHSDCEKVNDKKINKIQEDYLGKKVDILV